MYYLNELTIVFYSRLCKVSGDTPLWPLLLHLGPVCGSEGDKITDYIHMYYWNEITTALFSRLCKIWLKWGSYAWRYCPLTYPTPFGSRVTSVWIWRGQITDCIHMYYLNLPLYSIPGFERFLEILPSELSCSAWVRNHHCVDLKGQNNCLYSHILLEWNYHCFLFQALQVLAEVRLEILPSDRYCSTLVQCVDLKWTK